jgi:hypothetical protein
MTATTETLCTDLIAAHCNNFMCAADEGGRTIMGKQAHELYFDTRGSRIDPCDPKLFNPGFPYRIWRDSGIGYALGRNRPEYSIDGQAASAPEAVEMAGSDGVVVTARNSK